MIGAQSRRNATRRACCATCPADAPVVLYAPYPTIHLNAEALHMPIALWIVVAALLGLVVVVLARTFAFARPFEPVEQVEGMPFRAPQSYYRTPLVSSRLSERRILSA